MGFWSGTRKLEEVTNLTEEDKLKRSIAILNHSVELHSVFLNNLKSKRKELLKLQQELEESKKKEV